MILGVGLAAAIVSGVVSYRINGPYGDRNEYNPRVRRMYDPVTGRLQLVVFASSGNLKFDTWAYMDGKRLIRMDIDDDEDGKIDRREYFDPREVLERIEYLSSEGHVTRTEFYQKGALTRTDPARDAHDGETH
jgi:hypothetical protein